jgi:RNA polymerase sigma-70 factor (ECF subfamily)
MEAPVSAWQPTDIPAEGPRAGTVPAHADALEAVMRQHNQRLYRLALSLVGDPTDAEDVLQDSYFRAFEKRASFAAFGNPELGVEREEARAVLESAILGLPPPFRAVFMLREVEGLTLRQTATYLRIPVATVKTRAHRARLLLQAELGPAFPGEPHRSFEFLRDRCDRIVSKVLGRLALL